MFVDSHCHLDFPELRSDLDGVMARMRENGITHALTISTTLETFPAVREVARSRPNLWCTAGVHPDERRDGREASVEDLLAMANDPKVVAIGETGLDYDRGFSPRETQLDNLRWHIALARRAGQPLILHCRSAKGARDAQDDLVRELRAGGVGSAAYAERFEGRPPALLHSFSGPVDYAEAALDLGCAVSISGLAFRAGEETTASVARLVPAERLLVETDAPWLSPPGAPRRRNEPRFVGVTARWVAEQRGVDPERLGDDLVDAFDRTFGRPA
jgi:TatD DNase family protein